MYDRNDFISIFSNEETEELLDRLATRDLTDAAKEAIAVVLETRGIAQNSLANLVVDARKAAFRRGGVTNNCDACGKRILPGFAVVDGVQKFCDVACFHGLRLQEAAIEISIEDCAERAREIHLGPCSKCGRENAFPDVGKTYWIWSIVFYSSWSTELEIACLNCGRKSSGLAALSCLLLGWWSVPGIFVTPAQIGKNLIELSGRRKRTQFSEDLLQAARVQLADEVLERSGEGKWRLGP